MPSFIITICCKIFNSSSLLYIIYNIYLHESISMSQHVRIKSLPLVVLIGRIRTSEFCLLSLALAIKSQKSTPEMEQIEKLAGCIRYILSHIRTHLANRYVKAGVRKFCLPFLAVKIIYVWITQTLSNTDSAMLLVAIAYEVGTVAPPFTFSKPIIPVDVKHNSTSVPTLECRHRQQI